MDVPVDMRKYKTVENGYLLSVGIGSTGTEITEEEYSTILAVVNDRPAPPDGCGYRLREDLAWELYEMPVVEEAEEELTTEEAYNIIMGVEV